MEQLSIKPGKILITGTVRNCAPYLMSDLAQIKQAVPPELEISWLLIESDSSDKTLSLLADLAQKYENFRYLSFGDLKQENPLRTVRLAYCRNQYLAELVENPLYRDIDYLLVADLDGVNASLTRAGLGSCFHRDDWDVCSANQDGPYYDIWALRHKDWCPTDCWEEVRFLRKMKLPAYLAKSAVIYARMLIIPPSAAWIEVDSAFGGLTLYKTGPLRAAHTEKAAAYVGLLPNGQETCEHVSFHQGLKKRGARIFINPQMMNTPPQSLVDLRKENLPYLNSPPKRPWLKRLKRFFFPKRPQPKPSDLANVE